MASPQAAIVSLEHTVNYILLDQEYISKSLGSVEQNQTSNGITTITERFVLDRQVGALLAGAPALLA